MLMDSEKIEVVVATDVRFHKEIFIWYVITLKLGQKLVAAGSHQSRLPISFREKLNKAEQDKTSWDKLCIYRVPKGLRDFRNEAYDPRILSIGPYHRGKGLTEMDKHKWRCLCQVLKCTNQDASLYLDSIREIEDQARSCYDEPINLTSDQFAEMMVLDGCFLLELLCARDFEELGYSRYDPVFGRRGPWPLIFGDIIKLENQLPLFILDRLLALQIGKSYKKGLVTRPILRGMGIFDPLLIKFKNCLHFLDIYRKGLLPFPLVDHKSQGTQKHRFIDFMTKLRTASHLIRLRSRSSETVNRSTLNHSATKLREAGIKFKTRQSNCFLDIKFEDGVLKMPRLLFNEIIKCNFPNLIAFEKCHLDCGNDITLYARFMDHLIDTSDDVGYLHNCGILEPLGENYNQVADFFNSLCGKLTSIDDDSHVWEVSKKLSEQVDRYYNNKRNKWWVNMNRTYFGNPWSIINFIAATVLLVLTFLQTFYGMYAYYRPR